MFERPSWLWIVQVKGRREQNFCLQSQYVFGFENWIADPKFEAIQTPAAQLQAAPDPYEARNSSRLFRWLGD